MKPGTPSEAAIPIKFPISTIVAVLGILLAVYAIKVIAPLFLPLFIAALIAVALHPIVKWLVLVGFHRGMANALVVLTFTVTLALILAVIGPQIFAEASEFLKNVPQFRDEILKNLSPSNPLRGLINSGFKKDIFLLQSVDLQHLLGAGNMVLRALAEIFVIYVLTIYLLCDGKRIMEWFRVFFSYPVQEKITHTSQEVSRIISAYIAGQAITSSFAFIFVFISLSALNVPSALLLASLAAMLDVLPVLGFVLAVVPAMLFALHISGNTSLIVLALYVFYHALENYVIVPIVYGKRLRVSSFVVFFSLLAAGLLAGIEGAVAILPVIASYPIIEKIWLQPYLRKEALVVHAIEHGDIELNIPPTR